MAVKSTALIPTPADAEAALQEIDTGFPEVYQIKTQFEYDEAGDILRNIKAQQKSVDEIRKSMTRPIDAAKEAVLAQFRPVETRLKNAEMSLKRGINQFAAEQEERRRAEELKLRQAQAKKQALLEAKAQAAAEAGDEDKAEAYLAKVPSVPVVLSSTVQPEGITLRTTWKAEVVDFMALVQAVAEGRMPLGYLKPDDSALLAAARSLKDTIKIPGVKIFAERGVAARA